MADGAVEQELGCVVENSVEEKEVSKRKESDQGNNTIAGQVRNQYSEECSMEQTPSNENELSIKNSNLMGSDEPAVQISDKSNLDNITDVIDEPPDPFFDGVLTDDFLSSLAVVDAWDPDADDSYESDAETRRDGYSGQSPSESKKPHGDETMSKDSENKSKHDRSEDHGSQSDSRRRDRASVETKQNSKERAAHRKDKGDTDEQKHSIDKDKPKRYEKTGGRSRERGKENSKDNKERNTSGIIKDSRNHMEISVHRRDRSSKDRSAEICSYSSNRENKDESMERSDRRQRDKNIERSVQVDDKNKTSHRYSYQYRVSNKERTADISAKERNCDLRHSVSNTHESVHRRQESPKEVNRRDDGSNESQKNEKIPHLNQGNKESHRESIKNYHLEKGTSDVLKHVSENRTTEAVAVSQQHMITKCNNPPLNNTKLDTCIKELADVVPPGTENDFILSTKDESVKMVDDIKNRYITDAKEKPECKTVNNELLSEETKKPVVLGSDKSSKHPMVKSESQDKVICIASEKNDEHKTEKNDSEKASLCTAGQQSHREAKRVSSPHEREGMRSDSKRSVRRSCRKHGHLDEGRRRKRLRNSSEENERRSSSLERMYEASRIRNEQFNELLRKKRLLGSHREENCQRSRSRERWQHHSDLHGLNIKDDQNDTRRSWSGSIVKQHELSEGQERLGRSSSWDKHYKKTHEQRELSVGRERSRSASRDRQFRRASSAERWQPSIDAQRSNKKMDVQNDSRRSVRSLSRERQSESFLPVRMSRSRSRDREHGNEYRDRLERSRKTLSREVEDKRSLMKSRRSPNWDRNKHRAHSLASVGHMPLSPSISLELSSISSERESKRRSSHLLSRERRSREYQRSRRDSYSRLSSGSACSHSDSFVSLSSLSNDSQYRRQRRKRSPFWKEIERQFAKDLGKSYYQSTEYSASGAGTAHFEVHLKLIFFNNINITHLCLYC
jgi:hypothetical protein